MVVIASGFLRNSYHLIQLGIIFRLGIILIGRLICINIKRILQEEWYLYHKLNFEKFLYKFLHKIFVLKQHIR